MEPWRIWLTYLWRHRRLPRLRAPSLFTEFVQVRKLHDRDARLPVCADKVAVKAFVAERLGAEWVIPTLWHGDTLPARPPWAYPFVVKARHGCNQNSFVRSAATDWNRLRERARGWTRRGYGWWLDEWLYQEVPRGLLVEPLVGDGPELPTDYKFYVFGGRVEYIQVHLGRGRRHRWIVLDREWHRVSTPTWDADPPRPHAFAAMLDAAEVLARDFHFVRVDLYEVAGRPLFGELTFYPGSGLDRFDPVSLDRAMGDHWRAALAA